MTGWTYMLRCNDDSYYIGSTSYDDLMQRVAEHENARYFGYTANRRPVGLVWSRHFEDLRDAQETERRLKGWSRAKKEALIAGDESRLVALSRRRAGRDQPEAPCKSARQLAHEFQSLGARQTPELEPAKHRPPSKRKAPQEKPTRHLIPDISRHPEVRAKRAPKDA